MRLHACAYMRLLGALDDVKAEGALDDLADLADLEREGGVRKGLDHLIAAKDAEVAGALASARLVAVLAHEAVEFGALADLEQALLGAGIGLGAGAREIGGLAARVDVHHEDVLGADLERLARDALALALGDGLFFGGALGRDGGETSACPVWRGGERAAARQKEGEGEGEAGQAGAHRDGEGAPESALAQGRCEAYAPAVPLLDIVLGYDCNLGCTYCTITQAMRRRALSTAEVAREIDRAARRGFRDAAFTGGEPTIRSDLPKLVRYARTRGFEHVKVASNGLRYAHAPYLDHLVECGVDRFHMSMHDVDDLAYDRTVRLEGASVHRRRAIENLVARKLDPVADLILKEDTYRRLPVWIRGLREMGVGRFALWLVSLTDGNRENVDQLPRMSDLVPFLIEAFDDARRGGYELVALHVPRCFLPGYEDHVRHPGDDLVTVVTPDEVFDLKDSRLAGGVKPAGCAECVYFEKCPGLREDYIAKYGEREVKAVRGDGFYSQPTS